MYQKKISIAIFLLMGIVTSSFASELVIRCEKNTPAAAYAASRIWAAVRNYNNRNYIVWLGVDSSKTPESYSITVKGEVIRVKGGDERGMLYGALSIAEDLRNGVAVWNIKPSEGKPHYGLRAIKFDLPWDTYRHSYALDQHQQTCADTNYWRAFLDMMAENRFNALSLWNLHPYVYMIRAKNFPEASPFNDAELAQWQRLFRSIFRMAKERCIDTYLIPFNIFVSPEFAKAHNVAMDNLEHHFFVNGDTSEIIKRYTRESVTQVLQEYPDLTGFGLTLGEGMAGMTPQQREDWMKETIIEGMRLAGRKTKLVHRIPFSSSTGSLDVTSIETEKLTRKAIDEEGKMDFIEGPIWADLKYNWSHAHSTPRLYKVHGGKLYDTYFTPEPAAYKITWTVRNEDFFCLRWGVPGFVRDHIAANSKSYTGGYFIGSETYIPAKDYFTAADGWVNWKYAFERQWLFYKIWGRLLYDPSTPDKVFQNEFTHRYGAAGTNLLAASALAGKTPLRLASYFDFTWDFSLYSEGFLALNPQTKSVEYISITRQANQPPLDTNYVSVREFVNPFLGQKTAASIANKITPLMLADMLEQDCTKALQLVQGINTKNNTTLMYEVADIKTWSNLGLYFAEKLRGMTELEKWRWGRLPAKKENAVAHLKNALRYWDTVVNITRPIYKDMPLVHFTEQNGTRAKENDQLRFHWEKIRPLVAKDIEIAENTQQMHDVNNPFKD